MRWIGIDRITLRSIAAGIAVTTLVSAAPSVRAAYIGVPVTVVKSSSETTGAPTTSITVTQDTLPTTKGFSGTSLDDVNTQEQLVSYSASLMKKDPNIESVSISSDSISMTYRSNIYVQNFGTRSIKRTATVNDKGEVKVEKPWYASVTESINSDDPSETAFSDIALTHTDSGLTSETYAKILTRMAGLFASGAV